MLVQCWWEREDGKGECVGCEDIEKELFILFSAGSLFGGVLGRAPWVWGLLFLRGWGDEEERVWVWDAWVLSGGLVRGEK